MHRVKIPAAWYQERPVISETSRAQEDHLLTQTQVNLLTTYKNMIDLGSCKTI